MKRDRIRINEKRGRANKTDTEVSPDRARDRPPPTHSDSRAREGEEDPALPPLS